MRLALTAILIFTLLGSLVVGLQIVDADSQTRLPIISGINIISPLNSTYTSELQILAVNISALQGIELKISLNYSLDGVYKGEIPTTSSVEPHYVTITYANGTTATGISVLSPIITSGVVNLTELSEGNHTLTVYATYNYPNTNRFVTPYPGTITYYENSTVNFTINTSPNTIPNITPMLTPETTPPYTPTPPKTPNASSPSPSPSPSPTQTTSHYGPYSNVNPASFDLTIYSPDNQAVYAEIMLLKFNITWIDFVDFPFPVGPPPKGDYAYSIDDGPRIAIESNQSASDQLYILPAGNFTINPTFSNSVDISSLENGYHKIVIIVGLYRHSDYYYINQTSVPIMFLVQKPSPSPSPSPSPTIPEFPTWIIQSAFLIITSIIALSIGKKKSKIS